MPKEIRKSLLSRRHFLRETSVVAMGSLISPSQLLSQATSADKNVTVSGIEVSTVSVTDRTNWIIVSLRGTNGIKGLGEASLGRRSELSELKEFFELVKGESPFEVQRYRQLGWAKASSGNRAIATAFSAVEQALWDLISKSLDTPFYNLVGGKFNDVLPVYANINRATSRRDPSGFAENAVAAVEDGFKAIKAAPFDGFPSLDSASGDINSARDLGIACIYAMREAVGDDIDIKIDAHSFFDTELAISIARDLEDANLSWYEEPVAPTQTENTRIIHDAIPQKVAGGEFLFGVNGFKPLCEASAVDIIMPDVKHCGGVWEAMKISAFAEAHGIKVSPHNPSGPISTAVSASLCAGIPNFDVLEYQWGERDWRNTLVDPTEAFIDGSVIISDRPGFGISINDAVLQAHRV